MKTNQMRSSYSKFETSESNQEGNLFALLQLGLGNMINCKDNLYWSEYLQEKAIQQGVSSICLDGWQKLSEICSVENYSIDKLLKLQWIASVMRQEQAYKFQWQSAKALGDLYDRNNIDTYVMKGFSLSRLYPNPNHRPCTDLDCFLIDRKNRQCAYEAGNRLVEAKGRKVDRRYYKHSIIQLRNLTVENHRFLLPIKGSGKTKKFEKELRNWIDDGQNDYIENTKLKITAPFFDAVFVLAHAQEHFLNEGIALRHICDWAMVLKAYEDTVDWERWKTVCREYGMLSFGYAMSRLAKRICGVKIPYSYPIDKIADRYLLADILYAKSNSRSGKSDAQIRIGLIRNMFSQSWKYRMFSDTNFLMFGARRIWGYLFDKDID